MRAQMCVQCHRLHILKLSSDISLIHLINVAELQQAAAALWEKVLKELSE